MPHVYKRGKMSYEVGHVGTVRLCHFLQQLCGLRLELRAPTTFTVAESAAMALNFLLNAERGIDHPFLCGVLLPLAAT